MARQWSGGHSSSVLCVGASPGPEGLLASGGEGGELTVWGQDGAVVGRLCLPGEEDVTAVAFASAGPTRLYASHGDTVSMLDPRNLKGPAEDFRGAGEEEINALALSEIGSALAVADDSGAVRILELPAGKACRTLRRHTNICSSVAFRPHRPNNLVSVGLDMQVMLWGLQKTRPLWTVSLQDVAEEEEEENLLRRPGQLFNPPLAHCVSVSGCGNVLGCAAEDGRLHLMQIGGGSKLERRGAIRAHSQGASQAHFVGFLPHPYWLLTGGNDGRVALWDLSKHPVVAASADANVPPPRRQKGKRKGKQQTADKSEEEEEEAAAVEEEKSGPKLSIKHGGKVNWLCPAVLKGEQSVVVADQSACLTVYPLPQT
ncbi:WD repeat-containing protein 53 [Kryptolebias marmoratus]|uniref:WD repeat domain 53 n=1 Tax=Kryptolebias marmoratus TaxID=37003 RepID=A0A3Q3BD31_KRYMA|nr:WD repeat-containing protein 53 [Kryptolebias marmoratus]XP_017280100.1 WD repeat-containing protein 53 [Kryptolebias marmoratus]